MDAIAGDINHGTAEGADEYGCRCMPCVVAYNDWAITQNRDMFWAVNKADYSAEVVIVGGFTPVLVPTRTGWEFVDRDLFPHYQEVD